MKFTSSETEFAKVEKIHGDPDSERQSSLIAIYFLESAIQLQLRPANQDDQHRRDCNTLVH